MADIPFRVAAVDTTTQLGGVTGTYLATIHSVIKSDGPNAPYCVANELICSRIGGMLGLPIPPCAIVSSISKPSLPIFASLDFNSARNALPPLDPARCVTALPDLSTGLLLFDIFVANGDRHRGNLSANLLSQPPEMFVYDHSHAFFGNQVGLGTHRLTQLRDRLGASGGALTHGNRHCLLDWIHTDQHFQKWLARIGAVPDYFIEDLCHTVRAFGITAAEADAAHDFLKYRRDTLETIIHANRNEFKSIQQWSLSATLRIR